MVGPVEEEAPRDSVDQSSTRGRTPLTESTLYSTLADTRCRNTIHYIKQRGEPVTVREIADRIAAWEYHKEPDELTSKERKRVYISLYQAHLPAMDKSGVVEYDADAGTVMLSDEIDRHRIYLEVVTKNDIPWNLYYVGLSLAGVFLVSFAWLDVYPFGTIPDLAWAVVVLLMFGGSAFFQTYSSHRRQVGDPGPPPDVDL